ncbi:GPI inositol-deacylase [Balamuthia mandrillaris]
MKRETLPTTKEEEDEKEENERRRQVPGSSPCKPPEQERRLFLFALGAKLDYRPKGIWRCSCSLSAPRVAAATSSSLKGSLLSRRLKCGAFVLLWLVVPLGLLGTGFYAVYLTMEENYCANTYMRPVYLPMNLTSSSPSSSPSPSSPPGRYSLYLYREGNVHGKTPWKRKGVPVLFIPGNGGVYGQVRSFASEAARHALQARKLKLWTNEIDFFTVHFREELSALHGDLLVSQTEYVNAAIQHILRLYQGENGGGPSNNKPTSVILVGHSMGGLVARAVFTLRSYIKGSVNTIITLNSPHRLAPILVDRRVAHFYDYVNAFWKDRQTNKDLLEDVAIVSIAGSFRDSLILSELCNMEGLVPFTHGYSILTTSIPNVRVQVDHQCIVWCNSMVKAMTETLYGLVDPTTRQATLPLSERVAVLERGFYSFVPEKLGFSLPHQSTRQLPSFSSPYASSATNEEEEKGVKIMQSQNPRLSMSSFQDRIVATFRFELTQEDENLSEFVMFTNLQPGTDFNVILLPIDAHKPQINATGEGFTVPEHGNAKSYEQHIKERDQKIKFQQSSSESRKKQYYIIHLSSERLREYGSVELRFTREATGKAPDSFFVEAETSIASPLNRMEVPHYPWQQTHLWLDKGRSSALSNISLPKEDHRYPLFFSAQILSCDSFDQQSKQEPLFLPLLYTLVTPMASESFYSNATFVSLKFHEVIAKDGVRAIFFSDPSCSYQLTLRPDLVGMVGRMLATYIAWPIGFAIIVFYIILSQQLYFWSHRGQCPSLLLTSKLFLLSKVSLAVLLLPPFLEYMILSPASSLFADSFISLPSTLSECVSFFHNGLFNSFFAIFTSSPSSSSASSISTWLRTSKHSFQDLILVPPAWMFPVFYLFGYFLYFTILLIVWMLQYLLLAPFCRRLLISSSSSSSSPSKQHQERAIQATKNNTTNEKEKKEQRKLPKQQKTDDIRWQSMFSLVVGLVVVATLLWTAHSYIALVFVFLFFFVRFSYNIAADQPTPQNKSLHSYQQAVLLTVVPCLMMLTPAFIIWVNHLPVEWRTLDSNEPLVLMLYVHLCFASFSLPMPPKGTRSRYSTYALIGTLLATTIFVVGYCTFQFYRLLDVTLAIALMFCYAHAVNLFFIPPS